MWDCLRHPKPSSRHVLNVLMGCCCCSWFPLPCFANISLRKAEAVKHLYQVSDEISYQPCTPRSLFVNVVIMSFSTSILTPTSCTSGACFKLWHPLTSYDCDLPSTRTLTWQHHRPMIALFLDTFWPCVSCVSHLWCLPHKRLNLCILCWWTLFFHRLSNFQHLCISFLSFWAMLSNRIKPARLGVLVCFLHSESYHHFEAVMTWPSGPSHHSGDVITTLSRIKIDDGWTLWRSNSTAQYLNQKIILMSKQGGIRIFRIRISVHTQRAQPCPSFPLRGIPIAIILREVSEQ